MIARTQRELWGAPRPFLEATFRAYAGREPPAEISDEALRTRCVMLLLSAEYAAGHLGVPRGARPRPLTLTERGTKMIHDENFPAGTLAAELQAAAPARPAEPKKRGPRLKINRVRARTDGTSRLQPASTRHAIFTRVAAAGAAGITVEALDAAMGLATRPHLQKLLEKNHIEVIE